MEKFHISDPVGRLCSLGLPTTLAKGFYLEVLKWEANSGPAWTVDRLKSLKTDLLRYKAGLPLHTWIRKNRKGGLYGAIGGIFRFAMKSDKNFAVALSSLMIYSVYRPDRPTTKHIAKFLSAVAQPNPQRTPVKLMEDVAETAYQFLGELELGPVTRLAEYQGSPTKKSPVWPPCDKSVFQHEKLEEELSWISMGKVAPNFLDIHQMHVTKFSSCYDPVLDGINRTCTMPLFPTLEISMDCCDAGPFRPPYVPEFLPQDVCAGKVVPLMKDGGWKVRWIASPYRLHQLALKPLGSSIFKALKNLPWDCTYNQDHATSFIQEHLKLGKIAHAVDLTSATDYFPLDLQVTILKRLFPNGTAHIELFEALSRANWETPFGFTSWTVGQPMGLYPSFASFALAHGMLLATLAGVYKNQFFILGDDVVILDEDLHHRYLKALSILNCPHDPHKSFVSNILTEFAGKVITRNSVIPQYKWRPVKDDNFLKFMEVYGQSFIRLLTRSQKRVYRKVAHLLKPVGCEHSLGKARSLVEKVKETDEFLDKTGEKKGRKYYTSFLNLLSRLEPHRSTSLYHRLNYEWVMKRAKVFDQNTLSAFQQLPRWINPISDDLTDILEFTGIRPDLPAVGPTSNPHTETLLGRYERILKLETLNDNK